MRCRYGKNYHRPGRHYALVTTDNRVACLASIADSDLVHAPQEGTVVFTRCFSFRWAPKNCFTYMLSKLRKTLKHKQLLVTWHNPNIGVGGNQFARQIWHTIVREHGTQYRYQNGIFVTQRNYQPDMKVTLNTIPLHPLVLLGYPVVKGYNIPEPVDVQRPQQFTCEPSKNRPQQTDS